LSALLALTAFYAAVYLVVGLVASRRVRTASDFFVAGRSLGGATIFATLLAANIGAGSTVGAAGLGYRHGLAAWWWSGSAALGCVGLGAWVAPRLNHLAREHGLLTVGDYLEWRYDRSVRLLVAATLWLGSLSILAGQILAMAWAFDVLLGWPKWEACVLSGLLVVAYVGAGGLLASAVVNVVQLVVLLVGFVLAVPFAVGAAGGIEPMTRQAEAVSGSMGWGSIAGLALTLGPSFVVSPGLVQKTFGARGPGAARAGALANAAALAVFAFIPPMLGLAMRAVRPGLENPELALPLLLGQTLPAWLGAFGLAALLAAELSTADAVLFMLSTSLGRDLAPVLVGRDLEPAELLRAGRWATVVAGGLGVGVAVVTLGVADALKLFYTLLTAALFVPLVWGLAAARPTAVWARAGVLASVAVTVALSIAPIEPALRAWLPAASAIGLSALVFAWGSRA